MAQPFQRNEIRGKTHCLPTFLQPFNCKVLADLQAKAEMQHLGYRLVLRQRCTFFYFFKKICPSLEKLHGFGKIIVYLCSVETSVHMARKCIRIHMQRSFSIPSMLDLKISQRVTFPYFQSCGVTEHRNRKQGGFFFFSFFFSFFFLFPFIGMQKMQPWYRHMDNYCFRLEQEPVIHRMEEQEPVCAAFIWKNVGIG